MVDIRAVMPSDIESTTMSKVTWRLVPFLMLCYFIAYLDRVNVGFAGATDARRSQSLRNGLRRSSGHFLSRLLLLRGAEQPCVECLWCTPLDRPDHVHLGYHLRGAGLRHGRTQLQHRPLAARRRRGGLLPRHHFLPHALVSDRLPRPHCRLVHVRHSDIDGHRGADFRPRPRPGRCRRATRLAMDVSDRGGAQH